MMLTPIVTVWDLEILKEIFIKKFDYFPDRQVKFENNYVIYQAFFK